MKGIKTVAVIGLGYVGLPLACLIAEKGFKTIGFDVDARKIEAVNKRVSPFKDEALEKKLKSLASANPVKATSNEKVLREADAVIVCVPTPVNEKKLPDLKPLIAASECIARNLKRGQLVIVESTIYPGTIEEVVKPLLEKSGLRAGADFLLAHCPERIDPGNKKWGIENIPRVVGGLAREDCEAAARFYESLEIKVTRVSCIKAAEASKIVENSFRDVNIAFVNELAKSFDKLGIDVLEVINAASTKPFAFMPHYPGAGVGGHCISVDPYYLIERAHKAGFEHEFLKLAREINDSMPAYVVSLAEEGLKQAGKKLAGARVGVLGLAYKQNVDDVRESPAFEVARLLKEKGARVKAFDSFVKESGKLKELGIVQASSLKEALDADCVVLVTAHKEFKELAPSVLKQCGVRVVVDGRNAWDKEEIKKLGMVYRGVGRR